MESSQHPLSAKTLEDYVQVGVVTGVHGHDGRLRVQRETDNPGRFRRGAELWIGGRRYRVQRTGGTGDVLLIKVAGVETREQAAELLREAVLVPPSALPSLPEDSYYHHQLIGMSVQTAPEEHLGRLTEVINTGANDVYVVTGDDRELLLPAIGDVVREVDVDAGLMTVELPEGLEWRALKPSGEQRNKPPRRRRRPRKPPPAGG